MSTYTILNEDGFFPEESCMRMQTVAPGSERPARPHSPAEPKLAAAPRRRTTYAHPTASPTLLRPS
eukprot:960802-Pleurochrysis_carterae.AAC.2